MRARVILPICLAAAAGVGCVMLLLPILNARNDHYDVQDNSVEIVVAQTHLQAATEVTADMVRVVNMPADIVPPGAFKTPQDVIGRVLRSNVAAQVALVEEALSPLGSRAGLEGLIDDGFRAKTIKVDEWSSVAHFVKPESRVDVLSTERDPRTQRPVPKTVLKNVKVLAVGNTLSAPTGKNADAHNVIAERSVTLMLKPREVEIIVMHEAQNGRLSLALRSGHDGAGDDNEQSYGEFLDAQVPTNGQAQQAQSGANHFNTWVGKGEAFEVITYEKIGGAWIRHTQYTPARHTRATVGPRPLPVLRTSQPDREAAKLISAEQVDSEDQALEY